MKNILVIGSGAVGRGFIPWIFPPDKWNYYFDDKSEKLLNKLYKRGKYTTWMTIDGKYEPLTVKVNKGIPNNIDLIAVAVGTRNFLGLAERFMNSSTPILCCENDSRLASKMSDLTGNKNVFFCIPDVITSNTAPQKLLDVDSLSIVTEAGQLFIPSDLFESLKGSCERTQFADKEEMNEQWMAKLYLHNTPHCIAAYHGWNRWSWDNPTKGFIHEALADDWIGKEITGALSEMIEMVVKRYRVRRDFAEWYAEKELARFSNPLLFDPISRVAREPMRKLALSERLIGAAMLALQSDIKPVHTINGIVAAIKYNNPKDPDHHVMKLFNEIDKETFVQGVLHLRPEEKLYPLLLEALNG